MRPVKLQQGRSKPLPQRLPPGRKQGSNEQRCASGGERACKMPGAPRRSTKRLAQEQMEAAAGGESPRTPHSARGAEAAAADTAPAPVNTAYKAVMEVLPGPIQPPTGCGCAASVRASVLNLQLGTDAAHRAWPGVRGVDSIKTGHFNLH